jgi:hypothetical protein
MHGLSHAPFLVTVSVLVATGCSGEATSTPGGQGPTLDEVRSLAGVPDRGADPAVVLIDVAGVGSCAGALLAPDIVLTARRCVEVPPSEVECTAGGAPLTAARAPSTLRVLVGEDVATAVERARGYQVLQPSGAGMCAADVAFILLDAPIDDVAPLTVRATAAATGDHLRTVGYGARQKIARDHVPVVATTAAEFVVAEAPCRTGPGGPAIDEATGEVVGVLSRSEPRCEDRGAHDVFTRLDVASDLLDAALALGRKGTLAHARKEKKGALDLGATCSRASDCAAGACVTYASARYCSRACGPHDRCPAHFKCMRSQEGPMACVES